VRPASVQLRQAPLLSRKEPVPAAEPDQPASYQAESLCRVVLVGVSLSITTKPPAIKLTGVTSA